MEGLVRQSIGNGCGGRVQFPTTTAALFVVDFSMRGADKKVYIERRELFALFVGIVRIVVDVYCPSPVVCCCICASCLFDDANHGTSELPSLHPVDNNNKGETTVDIVLNFPTRWRWQRADAQPLYFTQWPSSWLLLFISFSLSRVGYFSVERTTDGRSCVCLCVCHLSPTLTFFHCQDESSFTLHHRECISPLPSSS